MSYHYILFYKPYDVLCQFTDDADLSRSTLKEFISIPDIYPVGRLDRDSEGLLLLTNDGPLNHQLINPKFHHPRTYLAQVENIPTPEALQQLRQGVTIQDYQTRPAEVYLLDTEPDLPPRHPPIRFRQTIPTAWIELTLTEGRNRQVRRMTAAVGFPTLRLVRVQIENLTFADLQPGESRSLTPSELRDLKQRCRERTPTPPPKRHKKRR